MNVPDHAHRPDPGAALAALRAGHARFRSGEPPAPAAGAGPLAAVLGCAEPQPEPGVLFGGSELFTVRTAGLSIGPAVLGSLEYAVAQLRLPLVVVLGHRCCRLTPGSGDGRIRTVVAALRHRSPLLDEAVRSGRSAIHGMTWDDTRQLVRSVRRVEPPPVRRPARSRPPGRRVAGIS
ncbi:carbonic anhydrase [Micromonospora mirobrigensis]|uniref:Carbonic anhydrase n=1 Tax=Micromonospora mirobrigensis TaxID=262898 RepID=A0A1C4V2H0_9ACTN|nr:carbonic anhydrase [Micromonospora mirobrigensis]SCE78015.1 Carbonic anhydrase [Micromonospora mirobrigensis]